jgi:hypothetical protein
MSSRALICLLCIALAPLSCLAQSGAGDGAIVGTVFDPAGAIVQGVNVTAQNVGTKLTRTVKSDATGRYSLGNLQPGEYELTFEAQGFARLLQKGVSLLIGQRVTLDARLQVSGTQETVTVDAEVPTVELNKTEQSSYITSKEMETMPLNGRRWDNFVLMTPATSADGTYGLVSYRGISGLYNNNMIDGADNNQAFFSEARGRTRLNYTISQAAIQEFQVGTSNYSAEFGRAAGGTVNAVTKSGTNEIHGEAFYFIRDQSMNATNPTLKTNSILIANNFTKPPDRRQQFGGAVGGPMVKDKFFYFLSYDQQKRNFPAAILPSSSTFLTIPPPTSGAAPSYAAAVNFFSGLVTTQEREGNQQVGLAKVDWQMTANNRLSTTFNIMRWDSPNGIQTGVNHNYDISANGADGVANEYIITRLNSVLRPTLINEFRFQYGRDFEFQSANGNGPGIFITGGFNVGMPSYLPRPSYPNEKQFQWLDNLSWVKGRHDLKIGGEIRYVRDGFKNLYNGGGYYSYSSLNAWAGDCNTPSYPFNCTAVAGPSGTPGKRYSSYTQAFDTLGLGGAAQLNNFDYGLFIQDNFKMWPNFTLSLGLRYELQTMPQPDQASSIDPRTGRINTDTNNLAPRIGFAWDPFNTNKTTIRGGYGFYYGRTQNSTLSNLILNNGERLPSYYFTPSTAGAPVFPNVLTSIPAAGAGTPSIQVAAPDFANPIIHEFELAFERELFSKTSISITYLGSHGLRLPYYRDTNLFEPAAADTVTLKVDCTPYPSNPACTEAPASIVVPFFRGPSTNRPNPKANAITVVESVANSWYHGMVIQVKRSFAQGFTLQSNFTWSKAIDNGQSSTTFTTTNQPQNPFNTRTEKALSDFDKRRKFVLNALYAPPFRNIGNTALRTILDGFQFSGIFTAADGAPISANTSGSISISGTSLVSSGILGVGGGSRAPWLSRNSFTSPGFTNLDFRVTREIKIKDRARIEFIVEAFNLMNHTNVVGIVTTAFNVSGTTLTARNDFMTPSSTSSYFSRERQLQIAARFRF